MKFIFNKQIELLYGLDYCLNRENNELKQYNTKEENIYLDEFYKVYKENITDDIKAKIKELGEYHQKAEYIFTNNDLSFFDTSIFNDWFENIKELQLKILSDIQKDEYLKNIDLNSLKKFYTMDLGEVTIILSMFISGGFGLHINNTYCILGVKFSNKLNRYKITGNLISKIYHEVSHPYLKKRLLNKKIKIKTPELINDCYKNNFKEELLARTFEIIFASKAYGKDYIEWAIQEQNNQGFGLIHNYIKLYLNNYSNIKDINDYIKLLEKR